jgi:hypothetical protein
MYESSKNYSEFHGQYKKCVGIHTKAYWNTHKSVLEYTKVYSNTQISAGPVHQILEGNHLTGYMHKELSH